MERLPGPGTILAGRLYSLPAVLGRSVKPTYHYRHLRIRAGTPGFSGGDGCHCRRFALISSNSPQNSACVIYRLKKVAPRSCGAQERISSQTSHQGVNRFQWPSETTSTAPSITLMAV